LRRIDVISAIKLRPPQEMKLERLTYPPRAKVSRSNFMFRGACTPDVGTTFSAAEREIRTT
jgi:hypothetical protein